MHEELPLNLPRINWDGEQPLRLADYDHRKIHLKGGPDRSQGFWYSRQSLPKQSRGSFGSKATQAASAATMFHTSPVCIHKFGRDFSSFHMFFFNMCYYINWIRFQKKSIIQRNEPWMTIWSIQYLNVWFNMQTVTFARVTRVEKFCRNIPC
jgi:hypothetical protein